MASGSPLTMGIAATIRDAVRSQQAEAVALLQQLVRVPTENPKMTGRAPREEALCQDLVAEALSRLGLQVDRFDALPGRPNVVGRLLGTGTGPSLLFNGHVDVVPAGDPSLWRYPPFSGAIAEGNVWGRGACDMKGGIVTAIMALAALQHAGIRLAGDVVIHSVIDEETGGPGTRAAIERGYVADAAICVEPTSLRLMPVEGGLEWVRIVVRGVPGHAAFRYRSVHAGGGAPAINAIEKMLLVLRAIQELEREQAIRKSHPLLPPGINTINPGVLLGGTGGGKDGMPNVVTSPATFPDYCSLELDLKYLPTEAPEDVRREFEAFIGRVAATDPWLADHPPEIAWGVRGVSFPPAETSPDHPLIQALATETAVVTGTLPAIAGFEAVADLAWLSEAGMPCTLFGPGNAGFAHAIDERIAIEELVSGTEILARLAVAWCGLAK